jgi:TRAP-type C4-dicarboxylate transport system substrate-binding protein
LDPDLQKIVQEGAYKGAVKTREMLQEVEENAFAKMKDSFKEISYPELEPFRTKVAPVYDEFRKLAGKEVVDEILAAVAEYRNK